MVRDALARSAPHHEAVAGSVITGSPLEFIPAKAGTGTNGYLACAPHSAPSLPGLTRQSMMYFRAPIVRKFLVLRLIMDARVKPAHDAEFVARC